MHGRVEREVVRRVGGNRSRERERGEKGKGKGLEEGRDIWRGKVKEVETYWRQR